MADAEKPTTPAAEAAKPAESKTGTAEKVLNETELRDKLRKRVSEATELNEEEKKEFLDNLEMIAKVLIDGDATAEEEKELKEILPDNLEAKMMEFLNDDLEAYAKALLTKQAVETKEKTEVPEAQKLSAFSQANYYAEKQPEDKVSGAEFVQKLKYDLTNFALKQEEMQAIDFAAIERRVDAATDFPQKKREMQQSMLDLHQKFEPQITKYVENRPDEKFSSVLQDFVEKSKGAPYAAILADVFLHISKALKDEGWSDFGLQKAGLEMNIKSFQKTLQDKLGNYKMTDDEVIALAAKCYDLPKENELSGKFDKYIEKLVSNTDSTGKPPDGVWRAEHLNNLAAKLPTAQVTPKPDGEKGSSSKEQGPGLSEVKSNSPEQFWLMLQTLGSFKFSNYEEFKTKMPSYEAELTEQQKQEHKTQIEQGESAIGNLLSKVMVHKYFDIPLENIRSVDPGTKRFVIANTNGREFNIAWNKKAADGSDLWLIQPVEDRGENFQPKTADQARKEISAFLLEKETAEPTSTDK